MISPSKKRKLLARYMRSLKAAERWVLVLHDDFITKKVRRKACRSIFRAWSSMENVVLYLEEDLCDP